MTRHKDSPTFIEYLKTVIPNLIGPLKTFTDKFADGRRDDTKWVSGYSEMAATFKSLGKLFASLDEVLSESKALFIWDIVQFVNPKYDEGWNPTNSDILKHWLDIEDIRLYDFSDLVIGRLGTYDAKHKTNISPLAKSMFFEYANAVCNADGISLSKLQKETISKFKVELFKDDFF